MREALGQLCCSTERRVRSQDPTHRSWDKRRANRESNAGCSVRQFTSGRPLIGESDHKPLQSTMKKPLRVAPKRLLLLYHVGRNTWTHPETHIVRRSNVATKGGHSSGGMAHSVAQLIINPDNSIRGKFADYHGESLLITKWKKRWSARYRRCGVVILQCQHTGTEGWLKESWHINL